MMEYVEAPYEWQGEGTSIFLAGGITGCPDWQAELCGLLKKLPLTVLNPRRANFPIDDPGAAQAQIEWEHRYLRRATAISFWFPAATLCPIALYELGAWTVMPKSLFIGVEPGYAREQDVRIQTLLARPYTSFAASLEDLADSISIWSAFTGENGE